MDETRRGCSGREDFFQTTNNDDFAEKYNLELVAGSVFYAPYSKATDVEFCRATKCLGSPFPFIIPGESKASLLSNKVMYVLRLMCHIVTQNDIMFPQVLRRHRYRHLAPKVVASPLL